MAEKPRASCADILADESGRSSGDRRRTNSPDARMGSRLVANRRTPGAACSMVSAMEATACTTCSQLSSTINIWRSDSSDSRSSAPASNAISATAWAT